MKKSLVMFLVFGVLLTSLSFGVSAQIVQSSLDNYCVYDPSTGCLTGQGPSNVDCQAGLCSILGKSLGLCITKNGKCVKPTAEDTDSGSGGVTSGGSDPDIEGFDKLSPKLQKYIRDITEASKTGNLGGITAECNDYKNPEKTSSCAAALVNVATYVQEELAALESSGGRELNGDAPDDKALKCEGRRFRSLTGEIRCKEESSSATAERLFTPLFGSIDKNGVSPGGYPNVDYLNRYDATFSISGGAGGEIYLINSEGGQALFEGFGVEKGKKIKLPPINPSGLSSSTGGGGGGAAGGAGTGEKETGFTANVKGLEDVAEVNVETVIDPETGEEQLEIEVEVNEDAPEEVQETIVEILKDGEVVNKIKMAVDVQEPTTTGISYGKIGLWIVALALIIVGVKFAVGKLLSKSAGAAVNAASV